MTFFQVVTALIQFGESALCFEVFDILILMDK